MTNTQEILQEFRNCNNPGEQIELFETLATSAEPPIDAFYEILQSIKLEILIVLAIQAFTKVSVGQRDNLKENEDLLLLLSKQAQSGQTDLTKWSAATAIKEIGYDFMAVSQCMSEDVDKTIEKIVQQKFERFKDPNLPTNNDYDNLVRFWTYGPFDKLREVSADYPIPGTIVSWLSVKNNITNKLESHAIAVSNQIIVSIDVMKQLSLRGLKEINSAMERAEKSGEAAFKKDECELFEFISLTSLDGIPNQDSFINEWNTTKNFTINKTEDSIALYKSVLIHCLQSNSSYIRYLAAHTLFDGEENLGLGQSYYHFLQENSSVTANAIYLFYQCIDIDEYLQLPYKELQLIINVSNLLSSQLSRTQVKIDCNRLSTLIDRELKAKRNKYKTKHDELNREIDHVNYRLSKLKEIDFDYSYQNYFINLDEETNDLKTKIRLIGEKIEILDNTKYAFDTIEVKSELENEISNSLSETEKKVGLLQPKVSNINKEYLNFKYLNDKIEHRKKYLTNNFQSLFKLLDSSFPLQDSVKNYIISEVNSINYSWVTICLNINNTSSDAAYYQVEEKLNNFENLYYLIHNNWSKYKIINEQIKEVKNRLLYKLAKVFEANYASYFLDESLQKSIIEQINNVQIDWINYKADIESFKNFDDNFYKNQKKEFEKLENIIDDIETCTVSIEKALTTKQNIQKIIAGCLKLNIQRCHQYFSLAKVPQEPNLNYEIGKGYILAQSFEQYNKELLIFIQELYDSFINKCATEIYSNSDIAENCYKEKKELERKISRGERNDSILIASIIISVLLGFILIIVSDSMSIINNIGDFLGILFITSSAMGIIVAFFVKPYYEELDRWLSKALHQSTWQKEKIQKEKNYHEIQKKVNTIKFDRKEINKVFSNSNLVKISNIS